jgi:hypothetical protein
MKLPASESAYVPREKITEYLLSLTHPVGHTKALFFRKFGYNESNIEAFEEALLTIARNDDVVEIETKPYGVKYILEGSVKSPLNIIANIRTVWIVEADHTRPRFITAYPAEYE